MTLFVQQKNISNSYSTPQTGATNNANSSNITVSVGQNPDKPVDGNVDILNTQNTTEITNQTTLRNEGTVNRNINDIANKTGLNKNDILELIQKVTGKSFQDLLNLENAEYNKLILGLEIIINDCKVNGKVDATKLEQVAKDYNIALQTGWSIKGFHNQQQNVAKSTLTQRLIETGCISEAINPNDPDYDAKMETAIEKFFEKTLLSRINKNTPQSEREQIYKAQLQTFGRLLINTPDGREKELLGSAIDKLYRANIVPAAKAGIEAMNTVEAKANFAKNIDYKEAVTTSSEYEEDVYMTTAQAQELAHIKYNHMNHDDIKADLPVMKNEAIEFFEKNKEILAKIDKKIENNETLTKEEEAIQRERKNLHTARYAGATTGVANSTNPTVMKNKEDLLSAINNDTYQIGEKAGNDFYREVLTEVKNFIENHPETLTMPKDEFVKLMDKVTDNNYSKVVVDIKNGTKTELTPPSTESSSKNNVQKTTSTTTETKQNSNSDRVDSRSTALKPEDITKPQATIAELYRNSEQQEKSDNSSKSNKIAINNNSSMKDYFRVYGGAEGFKKIDKEFGTIEAIRFTLNENTENTTAKTNALKTFNKLNCSRQIEALKVLYKDLGIVLSYAKESTSERVQYIRLRTFGATKEAHEAAEKELAQ